MSQIIVSSNINRLAKIYDYINKELDHYDISISIRLQIEFVIEEVFTNVIKYGYCSRDENVKIIYNIESLKIEIKFLSEGTKFNPFVKVSPEVSLTAKDRGIGGLGMLLIKNNADNIYYEYNDNTNILTVIKKLRDQVN